MKTKEIFFTLLLVIILLLIPNTVKAKTSSVKLESITVTSPKTGTYKTGEKITIVAKYSDKVIALDNSDISLVLKFGRIGTSRAKGSISGNENTITFEYTITDNDNGELSIEKYSTNLKDVNGDYLPEITDTPILSGSKIVANPVTWTDTTNFNVSINEKYDLDIKGITEQPKHIYYVFITNTKEEPVLKLNKTTKHVTNENYYQMGIYGVIRSNISSYLEKNGDIYYWICDEQVDKATGEYVQKFIVSGKKLERPKQKNLGLRMSMYFSEEDTSTFIYEPHDYNGEISRNINLKIGKVTDNSILMSIKNGEEDGLSKLLSYAKTAKSIYTGTIKLGKDKNITENMNLINEEYYYVYAILDDENGTYYPVEDISLFQASVTDEGKCLIDYLSNKFKWNLSKNQNSNNTPATTKENKVQNNTTEVKTKDTTVAQGKLPQTGKNYMILFCILLLITSSIIFAYQYNKYKKIK